MARMTYTIGEHIEAKYFYWARLSVEVCPVCKEVFITISNSDPGSTEEAIGVSEVCSECAVEHGGYVFCDDYSVLWEEYEEILRAYEDQDEDDEDEDDYTDLDKEKWENYWSDYNQCGVVIDWR